MRFLVDTQLPRRLTAWLRERGHEADHVLDLSLAQAVDDALWVAAMTHGAVIVSKDSDFAQWVADGRAGPQVLWVRTGNGATAELVALLWSVWPAVEAALTRGERLVEIRRDT